MKNTALTLLLIISAGFASSLTWSPTTASVIFYIKNAGITVDGSFSGLAASVDFDPNDLANSKITASVKVNTIKTGIDLRDKHLKGKDYFNESEFPLIKMTSVSFSKSTGNNYIGKFKLTIRDVSKTIDLPFTFTESGDKGTFKGEIELDRRDYNVGGNSFTMGDDVKVKITLNTTKS